MTDQETHVAAVLECLRGGIASGDWATPLDAHVGKALPTTWAAIGFDTNALKQLRRFPPATRSGIFTFLQGASVEIVVPAQTFYEYWNNHGIFTRDVANLESDTRKLGERYNKLAPSMGAQPLLDDISAQISNIALDVADSQSPTLLSDSKSLWDLLIDNGTMAEVPRPEFVEIGRSRLVAGIAPGFADAKKNANALGDFFVWADFLLGLRKVGLTSEGPDDKAVVLVSDDTKEDWSASGIPHPVLLGEVQRIAGKPLVSLTMKELQKLVQ